ncbi:cutinase family protein [Rhodococcus tukisamuensis]|uniref:Cutinase n=1 Tax=Rhodococcus tukisamuensis TaxID=168276 RepID=A0A1G7C3P3_9NOCA|nr:cutinase family protein [Rhodococcus tukisamuensis]SDE33931.1 Cutinase [Rhodococcus tukisamuensis]
MTFRRFFARHRIASGMIAPAIVGVAAVITLPLALSSGPTTVDTELTASTTECHDMVTISVAGRGDTPVDGTKMLVGPDDERLPAMLSSDYRSDWIDQVVNAPNGAVGKGSYAAVYIAYPANMDSYEDAVTAGVANTETVMRKIQQSCPDTRFAVVGYSEGADVARRVAMDVGHQLADADGGYSIANPANVVGVVILADAGRAAGQGPFPGSKNPFTNPDGFDKKYQNGANAIPGQGALPDTGGDDFGALAGKVASFCSDGDLTCSAPQNISLLQLVVNVGRQLNVDGLERQGLTPATGQDVAVVLGQIAMNAFAEIGSQPDWMQSDETFLDVLLKVSAPTYKPGETPATRAPVKDVAISTDDMSPLAYLPQKVFNEIVGLIVTNQNTIPVVMSDPYNLTLGPDGKGHHFDYWRDANAANGKPLTSAEYAAAWLTELAKQAQSGQPVVTTTKPDAEALASVEKLSSAGSAATTSATASASPSATATATAKEESTPESSTEKSTSSSATATPSASVPAAAPSGVESPVPTTGDSAAAATGVSAPEASAESSGEASANVSSETTEPSPSIPAPTTTASAPAKVSGSK